MANRPQFLLLPGMMMNGRMWADQLALLRGLGDCTVAQLGGADAVPAIARQVLDAAPARFHAIGFSLGAIVALELWRQAPERFESLVLMGFSPLADAPDRAPARRRQMARAAAGELAELVRAELAPAYFAASADRAAAGIATVVRMAQELGSDVFARQSTAQLGRADSRNDLARITVPTLVLCGEQDRLVEPAAHRAWWAMIPGARIETVAGAGHLLTLEQPGAVDAHLSHFYRPILQTEPSPA